MEDTCFLTVLAGQGKGQDGFIRSSEGQRADSARGGVSSQASGQQTVI